MRWFRRKPAVPVVRSGDSITLAWITSYSPEGQIVVTSGDGTPWKRLPNGGWQSPPLSPDSLAQSGEKQQ